MFMMIFKCFAKEGNSDISQLSVEADFGFGLRFLVIPVLQKMVSVNPLEKLICMNQPI